MVSEYVTAKPIMPNDLKLGMRKDEVVKMLGEPFSFRIWTEQKDTLTELSYKRPRMVANIGYIVTTKLRFVGNKLDRISQEEFNVATSGFYNDSI